MATAQLKGTARFEYTSLESSTTITHLLAVPLLQVAPVTRRQRFDWWSADLTTREVVTVGDGVAEVFATIRCENDPAGLVAMLRAALDQDVELTYFMAYEDSEGFPVHVVAIVGASGDDIPLEPDPDRFGFGEYLVRVQLRRTDGSGTLDALLGPVVSA